MARCHPALYFQVTMSTLYTFLSLIYSVAIQSNRFVKKFKKERIRKPTSIFVMKSFIDQEKKQFSLIMIITIGCIYYVPFSLSIKALTIMLLPLQT